MPVGYAGPLGPWEYLRSHGLGNDYLVVDARCFGMELTPERIRRICDRHTGVGSDGILALVEAGEARFAVRIFNPDGSEAERSGNGLRIFAKFLFDHGYARTPEFTLVSGGVETRAQVLPEGGSVLSVRLALGSASIDRGLTQIGVDGETLDVTSVNVGNPHCVHRIDNLDRDRFFRLAPQIELHPAFPNRTNVQFAQVVARDRVRAWIWERGAGHTLASGTSSCAVAVAAFDQGLVDSPVTIEMEGGELTIELSSELEFVMVGPVEEVSRGTLSPDFRTRLSGPDVGTR